MPISWTNGRGPDVMQPMASPSIGGLAASLSVATFIAPTLFCAVTELLPMDNLRAFVNGAPDLLLALCSRILTDTQVWSQHNAMLAKFLKTSLMSFGDSLMILAVSSIPLLDIEARKAFLRHRSARGSA